MKKARIFKTELPSAPTKKVVKPGEIAIQMKEITKKYPGVIACDHINLDLRVGEIHALLGENGAGKTTLMNILYGFTQPDEGEIIIKGKKVVLKSPHDAIKLGIGMVHQHFMLIPTMTVTQNIILGLKGHGNILDMKLAKKRVIEISERYGLKIDPDAKIWQLSVGERQRVEIIKMLYRGAQVLIMDEPTAVLTPQESEELMKTLREMAKGGLAVIPFITHKLNEVMALCDKVTVLRLGKVVSTVDKRRTSKEGLAEKMIGRKIISRIGKRRIKKGAIVLDVKNLSALNDKLLPAVKGVSFSLSYGEILGIAGVAGNGQRELSELVTGLRKTTSGKISIMGKDMTNRTPEEIASKKVANIPEDRTEMGLVMDFTVAENLIMKTHSNPPFAKNKSLNRKEISKFADKLISEFKIAAPSSETLARNLSGGNLQKAILARELSIEPKILVAVDPTRGLDIGATEYVRQKIIEEKEKGVAVLLISTDLDEIMTMSDRIAVMYEGQIMGIVTAGAANLKKIGLMMAGAKN